MMTITIVDDDNHEERSHKDKNKRPSPRNLDEVRSVSDGHITSYLGVMSYNLKRVSFDKILRR